MLIKLTDYNNAGTIITKQFSSHWTEVNLVLTAMPLYLKGSLQSGMTGQPIFDPIGTNAYIKTHLTLHGWMSKLPLPGQFQFLGTDVDYAKTGAIAEVQFSNYPFLLNNLLRSELFFKAQTIFDQNPTNILFYIVKSKMFPASQSTLTYEQAESQLTTLAQHGVFDIPIRLIGLFEGLNQRFPVQFVEYSSRTSRTVSGQRSTSGIIEPVAQRRRRPKLTVYDDDIPVAESEADPDPDPGSTP
jgi:hypothetical protein